MKIAILNLYSGANNRGAESFIQELHQRLKEKHNVVIFSGKKVATRLVQPQHEMPKSALLRLQKRLFLDPAALSVLQFTREILPELKKERFELIIPTNGFWQVLLCKVFLKAKLLITGHSGPGWDERWNLYLKPDVFVATTEPTAVWARKVCPWTKVVLIPYGVDLDKYEDAKQIRLGLEKPIILCPAAAVPYKRIDLAIRAVANLSQGSLLYLGSGELKVEIEGLGEKLLGKRFRSLSVGYDEIAKYYAASDVVTLPSAAQENSPMVFLEAMASGKPIVATDSPRNRWVIGEAGLFVDPVETEKYAKKLAEAPSIDQNEIRLQAEKFSWEVIAKKYEELIANL